MRTIEDLRAELQEFRDFFAGWRPHESADVAYLPDGLRAVAAGVLQVLTGMIDSEFASLENLRVPSVLIISCLLSAPTGMNVLKMNVSNSQVTPVKEALDELGGMRSDNGIKWNILGYIEALRADCESVSQPSEPTKKTITLRPRSAQHA